MLKASGIFLTEHVESSGTISRDTSTQQSQKLSSSELRPYPSVSDLVVDLRLCPLTLQEIPRCFLVLLRKGGCSTKANSLGDKRESLEMKGFTYSALSAPCHYNFFCPELTIRDVGAGESSRIGAEWLGRKHRGHVPGMSQDGSGWSRMNWEGPGWTRMDRVGIE